MTTSQNAEAITQLLDRNIEALNAHDVDGILANQHPDATLEVGGGFVITGHDQLAAYTQALWSAFPDGTFRHCGRVVTDDAAAAELVFTGTHTGPLATGSGTVPPTGRTVTLHSASIMRFRDGRIVTEHAYSDQYSFMTQLGLLPPPSDSSSDA